MENRRLVPSRSGYREDVSTSHSKKNKKKSSKRNSVLGPWVNNVQSNPNTDIVPDMEYQHLVWQSNIHQNFSNNGQRLFTATSDPGMCGFTQMPMTYTMEPVSMPPMYRLYQPVPFSGMRSIHNSTPIGNCNQNHPANISFNPNTTTNGYTSLQENGSEAPVPINYQNGDYASLPPTANKDSCINGEELNSEHRRYSDPGLGSAEAPVHTQSDDSESVDSESSITTIGRGNKLVLSLIEQMTELKKGNNQLFTELNETKSDLESIQVKMIQCKHSSSDYQPGMVSDLIQEIREASKTSEEGLIAKVKAMMEEMLSQRSAEMEKLNNQIQKLLKDKKEKDSRIAKLEEEVATLKLNANNEGREIAAFEEETLALRRELQEARSSKIPAENHMAKLENRMDNLRNKMIPIMDEDIVDNVLSPGLIKAKRSGSSSASSEEEEDEEDERQDDDDDQDEKDDNVDNDAYDNNEKVFKDKFSVNNLSASTVIENTINLSGPVTDL